MIHLIAQYNSVAVLEDDHGKFLFTCDGDVIALDD